MRQDLKMMGHDGSGNLLAPSLTLHLDFILGEFPENRRKEELNQVTFLMLRKISDLRKLYNYYCSIGHNRVQNNKSELTRLQFWRFILDSHIHHYHLSLPDIDRILAKCMKKDTIHQPLERLSLAEFLSSLAILGYKLFKDKIKSNPTKDAKGSGVSSKPSKMPYVLSQCLTKLINDHIMVYSGRVKGGFLFEPRRNVNALKYMEGSWKVFRSLCEPGSTSEPTVFMRKLLLALTRFQIVGMKLSTEKFLHILASDHPNVNQNGDYNLEVEMTFLEYFEILLECAVTFVTTEDLEQQMHHHAQEPRQIRSEPNSAVSGLGHSRPGSAYSKRSLRSARSLSARSSTVSSIGESDEGGDSASDKTLTSSEIASTSKTLPQIKRLVLDEGLGSPEPPSGAPPTPTFDNPDDIESENRSGMNSPKVITTEMREKERQFSVWSHQLKIFFTRHLFPAWYREEMIRKEAARHRDRKRTK